MNSVSFLGMQLSTATIWTWAILLITGAIIVGAIWYYASQNEMTARTNNNDMN